MKKSKVTDIVFIGVTAAIISVCSWITVPALAVPITLQTLGICTCAGVFGLKKGSAGTLVYILIGALGVPVFSGFKGGIGVLFGATGGYIIGFIFTALIVGFVSDKTEGKLPAVIASMAAGVLICYAFGTAWFATVFIRNREPKSLKAILSICVVPFIIPDAVKIAVSGLLTHKIRKIISSKSFGEKYENEA